MKSNAIENRPSDIEDILEQIICLMAEKDPRWVNAPPSAKKLTRVRYRSLYGQYKHSAETEKQNEKN